MSREEGRRHCLFMDSKGLVCASRTDLQHHKARRRRSPWLLLPPRGLPGWLAAPASGWMALGVVPSHPTSAGTSPVPPPPLRAHLSRPPRPALPRPARLQKPFAHDVPHCKTLVEAIQQVRPSVLIGVSTMAGAFSQQVLQVGGWAVGEVLGGGRRLGRQRGGWVGLSGRYDGSRLWAHPRRACLAPPQRTAALASLARGSAPLWAPVPIGALHPTHPPAAPAGHGCPQRAAHRDAAE